MPYSELDDENWSTIIHTIHQGKCILMLGPDASMEPLDSQNLPCTEILAREFMEKIKDKIASWNITLDTSNIAQASQYYSMVKGRNVLEAMAASFYAGRKEATSDLYRNLAALPFRFIVNTTPDSMLYNALKGNGKNPIVERYHFRGENLDMVPEYSVKEPLIFHLFGSIDEPDSLVLTEDDILDFLVSVLLKKPPLPSNIISAMRDKNKSMLFLGFGFRYWYLRILLHILKVRSTVNRSFAFERASRSNLEDFHRTLVYFSQSDYRISFYEDDIEAFAKKLRDKFEKFPFPTPHGGAAQSVSTQGPTIFMCHANEDKDKAAEIYEKLEAEGFRPWLDPENLRGGVDWDKHIQKTIKSIDYFLVLQSKALDSKIEGYVNKEIELAIDRQRYFRPGIRFIIPLKIEECDLLDDLDYLQTIDLSKSDNFSDLVRTIKRDCHRRNRWRR